MKEQFKKTLDFLSKKKGTKEKDTFCIMPWVHFHLTQNGNVSPCCQAPWDDASALGNINSSSIEEIWQNKKFRHFRAQLKANKPYKACERCYEKERMGWTSLRQITNDKYASFIQKLKQENFSEALYQQPVYFDIRFSNVCNLKCRICSHASSSSWHADAVALGDISKGHPVVTYSIEDEAKFFKEFEACIGGIKEIYFAGGEPILTEQHYTLLKLLLKNGKRDCKLFYNTNLSQLHLKEHKLLEYWKQFDFINLAVSLDDIGTRLEYQRKNARWETIENNLQQIKDECQNVELVFSPTVSVFNVLYLPEMHRTLVERSYARPEDVIPTLLSYPQEYNIRALQAALKKQVHHVITEQLQWLEGLTPNNTEKMEHCLKQYRNLLLYLEEKDLPEARQRFAKKVKDLDLIRKESFAVTFPELRTMLS
jgi:radical SAM protein with 4Fe4S-binding SPASM domain